MSGEEYVGSENGSGSDNSYVQVTSEEVPSGPLIDLGEPGESGVAEGVALEEPQEIPPVPAHVDDDDEEDLYGSGGEEEKAPEEVQFQEVTYRA